MEKALALDPEYALAWAGIADTYSCSATTGTSLLNSTSKGERGRRRRR